MTKQGVSIPEAPEYDPRYNQAVRAGNMVYVGGTMGVDMKTGQFAGPTIREQARQSLLNCQSILRAAGAELADAVMVHVLLFRSDDALVVNEVFSEFFPDVEPPRFMARIGVDRPGLLISMAVIAIID